MRLAVAAALVAAALPASAQTWRIERKDGVETVRAFAPDGHTLEFLCRRDGPRPGTGSFVAAFRVGRAFPFPTPAAPVALRIGNGRDSLELRLEAQVARPPPAPRQARRNAPRGGAAAAPGPSDLVMFALQQPGQEAAAATFAKIAALFADRRARSVDVEAKALGLAARFPGGAERELSGFGKGCLDGLPDPDDEVQGPWHHGVSSSDGDPVVTLTASADRGPDGRGPQVKLILACDHGEFSLRVSTPGRTIAAPFAATLTTVKGERRLAFSPGPAPEEATADAESTAAAPPLLTNVEAATLSGDVGEIAAAELRFDVYGLDFATRKMRTLCKLP